MIKYSFLLDEINKSPLADKPKRHATVFKKSMPKIIKAIFDSHKKTECGNLINIMINNELKLCSIRHKPKDFIYNIIVKEFPGPSNRFFLKILNEIHQARQISGLTMSNFDSTKRVYEIELKKVITKFNESEIQYKYFMKKLEIEEKARSVALLKKQQMEGGKDSLGETHGKVLDQPRKTQVSSTLPNIKESSNESQLNVSRRRSGVKRVTRLIVADDIQHIADLVDSKKESEVNTETTISHNLQSQIESEKMTKYMNNGVIINDETVTSSEVVGGVDQGTHYQQRKTKILLGQHLEKLREMKNIPEQEIIKENPNNESEDECFEHYINNSISQESLQSMPEIQIQRVVSQEVESQLVESHNFSNQHKVRPSFYTTEFPEIDQSTIVTINLNDNSFIDQDLLKFEDFEDEDGDGVHDKQKNLKKYMGGILWWNSDKKASQNLVMNMKNPLFKAMLFSTLLLLLGLIFLAIALCSEPVTKIHNEIAKKHTVSPKDNISDNPDVIETTTRYSNSRILSDALIKII